MKPKELILRSYARKNGDHWEAFCIDFCLAAQGDTPEEVKKKLIDMIAEYLYDAMAGEDQEFADQLLSRRAPFKQIATYYYYYVMFKFNLFKDGVHMLFNTPIPMVPNKYAD